MVDVAIVRFTKATHTAEVFTPGGSLADTAITQFVWCKTHAVGCAVATILAGRFGCATTIRRGTSSAIGPTRRPCASS